MATIQTGSVLERIVLKEGQLFLVADRGGDIKALNIEGQGLYYRDVRHLSLFELDVTGTRLTLLSSSSELNFMSELQFANDTLLGQDGRVLAEPRTISVNRSRFVLGSLHERVDLSNYNPHSVCLTVRFTVGSDFRDMFDVRGFEVDDYATRGQVEPMSIGADSVILGYRGQAGTQRYTHIDFDPPPEHIEVVNPSLMQLSRGEGLHIDQRDEGLVVPPIAAVVFQVDVPPMATRSITVSVTPTFEDGPPDQHPTSSLVEPARDRALEAGSNRIREDYRRWRSASTQIETDHEPFDRILVRANLDLRLLVEDFEGDLVSTAGIPWFAVPFGRDSLITAMQTLSLRPAIAAGTLRFLARHQGTSLNPLRGEEPGKILHEIRPGGRGHISASIYYGSSDATPLFLIALGEYVTWSGDLELAQQLRPNIEAALEWMETYGDADHDAFIESDRYPPHGLGSQGWKDSPDALNHRDGQPAVAPIALAEIQAYAYAAHAQMAQLFARFGEEDNAHRQRAAAERVRRLFVEKLAMADEAGPFWAMGLDREKQRIEAVTSNPGHALWAGLLRGDEARLTARRLLAPDMLSGWGIRTLSTRAPTYNPMSYHNGSVWPHENALIALGMKRAGVDAAAAVVANQIFEASLGFPGARLPELWCGFAHDQRHRSAPAQYPVGCSPQAWAAGSAFMLLQAVLGLEADAFSGVVRLRPTLPSWLSRVSYRNLRIGQTQVDFDVVRDGHRVLVHVIEDGGLQFSLREAEERDTEGTTN